MARTTRTDDSTDDLRVVGTDDDPDLTSQLHLCDGVTADDTLCEARLGINATALQPLVDIIAAQEVLPNQRLLITDDDGPNLRVAKWAAHTNTLCDACRHVLFRDYITHDCTTDVTADGTLTTEGDTVYDPATCSRRARRPARRLRTPPTSRRFPPGGHPGFGAREAPCASSRRPTHTDGRRRRSPGRSPLHQLR